MDNGNFKIAGMLSPKDFEGMKIGYQGFTTSENWAQSNLFGKISLTDNKSFANVESGLQMLRFSDVDGIILDEPTARMFAKNYPGMKVAGTIDTKETYGIAVKKGDPKNLLPKVNDMINEMKKNGEYDKLIKKHFGGDQK